MSRLINSTYITADGVTADPHTWPSERHQDDGEAQEIQNELLLACDAVLMGRETYEAFAPVWSARSGDTASDRMNAIEKLVASTTIEDPSWKNTTVIGDGLADQIARRKQSGGDIVQFGFGEVTRTLLDAGMVDELRLWVHPLLLGRGDAGDLLFREGVSGVLELAEVTRLASGIVILSYSI